MNNTKQKDDMNILIDRTDPTPLYYQIEKQIIDMIRNNELVNDAPLPTEMKLVSECKVSRTVIRQALLNLVNKGCIRRIRGKGTFVIGNESHSERDKAAEKSIALLTPFRKEKGGMFADVIYGAEKIATMMGYNLIFCSSQDNASIEAKHMERLKKIVSGLLVLLSDDCQNRELTKKTISHLKEQKFPFVLIDKYLEGINTDYAVTDNFAGGYEATVHLIKSGHKKVGLILADNWKLRSSLVERFEGYRKALRDYGVKSEFVQVINRRSNGGEEINSFIGRNFPFGIFASENWLAVKAAEIAQSKKLRVPEEIAIAGFDEPAEVMSLPIAAVVQPFEKIGEKAAGLLIGKIEGKIKGIKHVRLKPSLVVIPHYTEFRL